MRILETLPVPFPVLLKQWECCLKQSPTVNTAKCLCAQSVYIVSTSVMCRNGYLGNFRERSDNNKQYHKNRVICRQSFLLSVHWVLGFSYTFQESNRFYQNKWTTTKKRAHSFAAFFFFSFFGLRFFCRHVYLAFDDSEPFIKQQTINKLVSGNYPLLLDTILCFPSLNFFSSPSMGKYYFSSASSLHHPSPFMLLEGKDPLKRKLDKFIYVFPEVWGFFSPEVGGINRLPSDPQAHLWSSKATRVNEDGKLSDDFVALPLFIWSTQYYCRQEVWYSDMNKTLKILPC